MSQIHYNRTSHSDSDYVRPVSNYLFHGIKKYAKLLSCYYMVLVVINTYELQNCINVMAWQSVSLAIKEDYQSTRTSEQVKEIETFIENYSSTHGLPVPGRLPNTKEEVLLLPSDMSKIFVFRKYQKALLNPVRNSKKIGVIS